MKWSNRKHQFDELGEYFRGTKTIYLYGAVPAAKPLLEQIEYAIEKANQGQVDIAIVFVDRNEHKREKLFEGKLVISPEEFYQNFGVNDNSIVVLCVSEANCVDLWKQLSNHGIVRHVHSYSAYEFYKYLSVLIFYRYHKFYLFLIDMFLHTYCNLNCGKCIVQTYRGVRKRRTIEQIIENIDSMFQHVDIVGTMMFGISEGFLGGYELEEALKYISKKYSDRVKEIGITTNGTIVPTQSLLEVLKSLKVHLNITVDDYRQNVPLAREMFPRVTNVLQENRIPYTSLARGHWDQHDFSEKHTVNMDMLEKKLPNCICNAKGFVYIGYHKNPNRIYSCVQQAINTYLNIVDEVDDDGMDLKTSSPLEIIEFLIGYTEKGYLTACTRCNGAFEGVEATRIPVAVQIGGEDHER